MPSKKISIVLSDVDGTLLDSQKRITERAKAAIQKLRDAGIKFAVASARPPRGMKMIAEQIPLSAPIAALNGGMLVDPGTPDSGSRICDDRRYAQRCLDVQKKRILDRNGSRGRLCKEIGQHRYGRNG
jgi:HAD superfamily hydrolase (TIGR01484 family)